MYMVCVGPTVSVPEKKAAKHVPPTAAPEKALGSSSGTSHNEAGGPAAGFSSPKRSLFLAAQNRIVTGQTPISYHNCTKDHKG